MKKDKDRDSIAKIFFSAEYARAERSAPEEIIKLNSKLKDHPVIPVLLNSTPDIIMILNRYRQIVTANENFLEVLKKVL